MVLTVGRRLQLIGLQGYVVTVRLHHFLTLAQHGAAGGRVVVKQAVALPGFLAEHEEDGAGVGNVNWVTVGAQIVLETLLVEILIERDGFQQLVSFGVERQKLGAVRHQRGVRSRRARIHNPQVAVGAEAQRIGSYELIGRIRATMPLDVPGAVRKNLHCAIGLQLADAHVPVALVVREQHKFSVVVRYCNTVPNRVGRGHFHRLVGFGIGTAGGQRQESSGGEDG